MTIKPILIVIVMVVLTIVTVYSVIISASKPPDRMEMLTRNVVPVSESWSVLITGELDFGDSESFPTAIEISKISILAGNSILKYAPNNTSTLCLNKVNLFMAVAAGYSGSSVESNLLPNEAPVCKDVTWFQQRREGELSSITYDERDPSDSAETATVSVDINNDAFDQYPFDKLATDFATEVEITYFDKSNNWLGSDKIPAPLTFVNHTKSWKPKQIDTDNQAFFRDGGPASSSYTVLWNRPRILIVFSGLFLFVMFITPILLPLIDNRTDVIGIGFAFLLGIWVFRGILLPNTQIINGLMDMFFISSCFLIIASITLSLLRPKKQTNQVSTFSINGATSIGHRKRLNRNL